MAYELTTIFPQGNEFNQYLQALLSQALKHPQKSVQRRITLNKLLKAILQSGELSKQKKWRDLPNFDDFYNEALDQALLEICERLESYQPDKPVMAWVNFYFNNRFKDLVIKYRRQGITHIPQQQQTTPIMSLDDLDKDVPDHQETSEAEQLRDFISEDPEGKLAREHIQGHPDVTLQRILWLRFIEDRKWKDVSRELNLPISTLNSFMTKKIRKLHPYFQQYLK